MNDSNLYYLLAGVLFFTGILLWYEHVVHTHTEKMYRQHYANENALIFEFFSKSEVHTFDEIFKIVLQKLESDEDEGFDVATVFACDWSKLLLNKRCLRSIVKSDIEEAIYGGYMCKSVTKRYSRGRIRHVELLSAR